MLLPDWHRYIHIFTYFKHYFVLGTYHEGIAPKNRAYIHHTKVFLPAFAVALPLIQQLARELNIRAARFQLVSATQSPAFPKVKSGGTTWKDKLRSSKAREAVGTRASQIGMQLVLR